MGAFDALRIANSSLGMHQTWLDALAHNIANADTATGTDQAAFRRQMVVARSREDGGVEVADVVLGDANGRLVHDPGNALADADGMVRMPDMDMGDQMTAMVMAQRGFQASVQTTKHAQETYSAALQIGRG